MPDKEQKAGKNATAASAGKKKNEGSPVLRRVVGSILVLAVLALGVLLFCAKEGLIFVREEPPIMVSASFYTPVGEPTVLSVEQGGSLAMPDGPEIEGYTFLGWADENGDMEYAAGITLFENRSFSARYAIAFKVDDGDGPHEPYMPLDADGLFHPYDGLLRGDAVRLIYSILDTDAVGSGSFADADPSADYYAAAATLKDLGVLSGSRLHPDEAITYGELFEMLACFFPRCEEDHAFANVPADSEFYRPFCLALRMGWLDDDTASPNDEVRRGEAAHIFNILRGRRPLDESDTAKVGTILDVSFRDEYFWDIAEACTPHVCRVEGGVEHWVSSEPQELREEGFFFIGTVLHYADASGSALVNEAMGDFVFGPDGAITTGMPELDELVQLKLQELVDPETMTPEQMLRRVYDNVTYHNKYLRVNYYEVGEKGWINEEAYRMLSTGKGNCYCFAAEFTVLARALGFDAKCYSGTIGTVPRPHGWVEISFDGVDYVFDPNIEYEEHIMLHKSTCMYKLPPERYKGWYYAKGDPA